MRTRTLTLLVVAAALVAAGCKQAKSENPLAPSVAGPIAGVEITAPTLVTPPAGTQVAVSAQPITLTVQNAASNGQRPLSYLFEVALDSSFTNKVLSREGITPGDGQTSFRLPDALAAERTYYWRARAQDGANTGPYSGGSYFSVYTPVVLQAPVLQSPIGDGKIQGRTPTFKLSNAARTGPVVAIVYDMQVATNDAFTALVASIETPEQSGSTQATYPGDLAYATRYFWRARARETSRNVQGPWSSTASFQTPVDTSPGSPSPITGKCPDYGPDLVACVMAKYPSYLASGVSSSQRRANMEYLRDRTIEEGNCAGMQLGWNLKRGGPEVSADYLTYFSGGRWIGVDIAYDYDNTSTTLRMQWGENPSDPYTTHADYTNAYSCSK
jgi:hypothetical protein